MYIRKSQTMQLDSGGGSVGKAVASENQRSAVRLPTSPKFLLNNDYCQLYWKDENKEKRGREWPIFLKKLSLEIK